MARRRKLSRPELNGRDTYHVLTAAGAQLEVKAEAHHALVVGHRHAERLDEPGVLTVERRSLFGPAATVYKITRTENGNVYTNSSRED